MRNKITYKPKYKPLQWGAAMKIVDHERMRRRLEENRDKNFFDTLVNALDVLTGAAFDRFAVMDFDYMLVGTDNLINAIVSSKLAMRGKKVLINGIPEFNLPENYQNLEQARFNLQNEMFCKMISEMLFHKQMLTINEIIEECFSESTFNHSKRECLPILSQKRDLHIYKGESDAGYTVFTGNNAEYPIDTEAFTFKRCVQSVRLLRGHEHKGFVKQLLNYDNLIHVDKIILTSFSDSKMNNLNSTDSDIIKLGSALISTDSFSNYTIIDRFKEIHEAIKIADSI